MALTSYYFILLLYLPLVDNLKMFLLWTKTDTKNPLYCVSILVIVDLKEATPKKLKTHQ